MSVDVALGQESPSSGPVPHPAGQPSSGVVTISPAARRSVNSCRSDGRDSIQAMVAIQFIKLALGTHAREVFEGEPDGAFGRPNTLGAAPRFPQVLCGDRRDDLTVLVPARRMRKRTGRI